MVSVQASLGWLHHKAVSLQVLGMILYIIHPPLPFQWNQPVSAAYTEYPPCSAYQAHQGQKRGALVCADAIGLMVC